MTNRRQFLCGSLAFVAGTGTISSAQASQNKIDYDRVVDVLIIGAGQAGLCAAIAAKEAGADKVLVVEKASACGGHTAISGGGYWIGGTDQQKQEGVEDSLEINWKDAVDRGIQANGFLKRDTAVAYRGYKDGIQAQKWLMSHGVKFAPKLGQSIGNRRRIHYFAPGITVGSPVEVETLRKAAVGLGAEFLFNTQLLALQTESGKPVVGEPVVGALVQAEGGQKYIRSRGGVVLACGGYANNPEMVQRYHPYLKGMASFGSPFNTGDGLMAAMALGANFLVEYGGFGFNVLFIGTHKGVSSGAAVAETPLIVVNKSGKRVQDESRGYLACCHALMRRKEYVANWVFDSTAFEAYKDSYFKIPLTRDVVSKYASLEELAQKEGIDKKNLVETIKRYNAGVDKGKDTEFGRTKNLKRIEKAPFYSFECSPKIYTSYSGLEINIEAQVLTQTGDVIPGLYAAGDMLGHLAYLTGLGGGGMSGIVQATVYGRIAGTNAADRAAKA